MALNALFLADFSSFLTATRDSVAAMQGFKESALELGPATDRSLAESEKHFEQLGRQIARVGADAVTASQPFLTAFAEEQAAVARLTASLEATGQATPAVIAAYAAMAEQFQQTTRYSDDAVTSAQATLTTIGKVGPAQMQLALNAATNLATFLRVDLATATDLVAKAVGSGGESLGRLKTILGETVQPGMDTAAILNAIAAAVGPANQRDMQTYAGQTENLANQMANFQSQVGEVLIGHLQTLLGIFQALPDPVQKFSIGVIAVTTAVAPLLVSLASLASLASSPAIVSGLTAIGSALAALVGWPALIVAAIAGLAYAMYKYWDEIEAATASMVAAVKGYLVDELTRVAEGVTYPVRKVADAFSWLKNILVGHSIVPDMIAEIAANFGQLDQAMVQPAATAAGAVAGTFSKMAQSVSQSVNTAGIQVTRMAEALSKYNAQFGGYSSIGQIGGGPAEDFLSWALEHGFATKGGGGAASPSWAAPTTPTVTSNITMNGVLSANDPQTQAQLKQVVGDALTAGLRDSRLLGSA